MSQAGASRAEIVLIDNHDSFTYNLVQYLGELGAHVRVILNDAPELQDLNVLSASHLMISPGPGRPSAAGYTKHILRRFVGKLPVLGVCLGHQAIAEVYGGRVIHAPELVHGRASRIEHTGEGLFESLPRPMLAGRYHSLVIDEGSLPKCLRVTARSEKGLIMAITHEQHQLNGVQFHPESILSPDGKTLLANFLKQE